MPSSSDLVFEFVMGFDTYYKLPIGGKQNEVYLFGITGHSGPLEIYRASLSISSQQVRRS
jgi:hypothetical protein